MQNAESVFFSCLSHVSFSFYAAIKNQFGQMCGTVRHLSLSLSRESPVSSDWTKDSICQTTILEDPDPDELSYSLLSGESFRLREASHWHLQRKTPAGKKVFQKLGWFYSHCFCGTFWSSVAWGLDCPWVVRLWWGDADGCLTNRSVVLWIINPTDLRANGS